MLITILGFVFGTSLLTFLVWLGTTEDSRMSFPRNLIGLVSGSLAGSSFIVIILYLMFGLDAPPEGR